MPMRTAGSGLAPEASSSCSQNTVPSTISAAPYALVTSSFQSVRSSTTEQAKLLAQRSRTSLNQFLGSVLDKATTLAESNAAHESYPEEDEYDGTTRQITTYAPDISSTRPRLQRNSSSRPKFFVCDESEDDEDEDDGEGCEDKAFAVMAIQRSKPLSYKATGLIRQVEARNIRCEDTEAQDCGAEGSLEEEADSFDGHLSITTHGSQPPSAGVISQGRPASPPTALERRQSLLSDLLQAEREQRRQEDQARSKYPADVDNEPQVYPTDHRHHDHHHHHHHHQQYQQQQQRQQYLSLQPLECNRPLRGQMTQQHETTAQPHSPLVRTRKVYRNLDGLALVATATATTLAAASSFAATSTSASPMAAPILSTMAPKKTTLTAPVIGTMITKATAVAGWSRSHVQVQIQSLVVQSTSTAQRALLNASSTLTDILFQAAK
ncbi:hypothetical protein EC968_006773 [Mortierella alpina]|nr:hypothetical protein EC968_006773 [Mortierella alpina]